MLLETHLPSKLSSHPRLSSDYAFCKKNKVIYYHKARPPLGYEEDYFFQEYKKQYGRSYLEDESHLRLLAQRRLRAIESCISRQKSSQRISKKKSTYSLLEIGCAFGFFLDEARQAGFRVRGIETSEKAASYAKENLKLNVHKRALLDHPLEDEDWDVICAFYVLEHIPQQRKAFTKIASALKKDALFCFALPSTYGPLFRRHPQKWMQTHPPDHFADYSPKALKKTLPLYDLSLYKLWPPSYHPDRLGAIWKKRALASLYRFYARAFCYADTLEGIAVKK